jgi:hypothetical protein
MNPVRARPYRSTSGPISGATTANGAMVSTRYRMIRGRAASTDTLKKSEPARDTAKNTSALALTACVWASRMNGIGPSTRSAHGLGSRDPGILGMLLTGGTLPPDRAEATLRTLTSLAAITLAVVSCGSDGADATDRDADVYVSVIRALAPAEPAERGQPQPPDTAGELDGVVYAGPLDEEEPIPLEVQAAVVEQLVDFATVRFVDERTEAIDDRDARAPVLEDGVLVLVGPVPAGSSPSVDAERYVDAGDTARVRVDLEPTDDEWQVVGVDSRGR